MHLNFEIPPAFVTQIRNYPTQCLASDWPEFASWLADNLLLSANLLQIGASASACLGKAEAVSLVCPSTLGYPWSESLHLLHQLLNPHSGHPKNLFLPTRFHHPYS
ncbi:hypothetical protein DSO57_1014372 [Entomophthora muscae]|uniref:Uncharacterized protein n=1 Tax=Entomophthora muscae TaxID=34485 RepID=A0ACC2SU99_9FUNG|nr:hypothetical protein DSO57_1014372 [Entomophthora muscae]